MGKIIFTVKYIFECYDQDEFDKKLNNVYPVSMENQNDDDCQWIPRQDQLQQIIRKDLDLGNTTDLELLNGVAIRAKGSDYLLYEHDWNMEQLWLVYYMHRVHKKQWAKNEWVNIIEFKQI